MEFFNSHSIPPLVSALLFLLLGVFIFSKNKKSKINLTFFLVCLSTFWWQFSWFILFNTQSEELASILVKVGYAGIILIPTTFFHFSYYFLDQKNKMDKIILYLSYSFTIALYFILFFTNYLIDGYFIYYWGFYPKANFFHFIYLIFLTSLLFRILYSLIISLYDKKTNTHKFNQIKYFLWAMVFYTFAASDFLVNYGIEFYPLGFIFIFIFLGIIGYSIIAYRLMDVKLVMRKYTVLILSITTILIPVIGIKYIFIIYLTSFLNWADVLILVLSISSYPILKNYFYRLSNKYFFSSLYDSGKVITEISNKLRTTLEINTIYQFIHETLTDAFHFKSFGVLTYSSKTKIYTLEYNRGVDTKGRKRFPGNDKLHKMFISQNKNIITEDVKNKHYNRNTKSTIDLLTSLKIEILAPLNVNDKTIGLIALGQKESGDMYNEEDLKVLNVVNSQAAIAIENATLYKETLNFNLKLKREVEKRTKELKSANVKLKQLDKAKSEFISIASHQLRTPLTVIKGYISMILEGNFGELDIAKQESLEKVYESNERLIQLVENLLNISRIESGRLQFNYEIMHFEKLVDSVMDELSQYAKKKGLKLIYKKPAKKLPKVKMDEEKLRQVVMNLIDNAIKYTKKGTITVTLKLNKKNIDFCVSDSGMGISPTDLPNLFKKFSRGSGTSVVHTEGTGLGLYVADQMIKYHKGKVWAESNGVNRGSKFCFLLPIYKKK